MSPFKWHSLKTYGVAGTGLGSAWKINYNMGPDFRALKDK